jgi:hypothetical protein
MRAKLTLIAVLLALGVPASAQIETRPTDPPLVTAANESWYLLREPVQFAGDLYYPAGPAVFFNGNTMVRSGHYNGVPLYTDTTVEPFSVVLVPVSRGQLQPYERVRPGEFVGVTGRRALATPLWVVPETVTVLMAPVAPTMLPVPAGAISVYTPELPVVAAAADRAGLEPRNAPPLTDVVGTTGIIPSRRQTATAVVSMRRPENNDGVWIMFAGEKWISSGIAVPPVPGEFVEVGEYAGFPVFARRDFTQEVIYLPSRAGLIAPYRLKE